MSEHVSVSEVEDAIRTKVQTRRMRLAEFFKDYDRLRSGCITKVTQSRDKKPQVRVAQLCVIWRFKPPRCRK